MATENSERSQDRIVWIDCEMTGLNLTADALIEVAALVTDSQLTVLGDGVDVVIRPPEGVLEHMEDIVRNMHTSSGLLDELDAGITLQQAEDAVMEYVRHWVPESRKAPLAGNSVGTDRGFLARDMPELEDGLRGLEETRRRDLEVWMDVLRLDAVAFPAVADVGPADMDVNAESADLGWRNGVWIANGNLAIRHLGIPTVTVPMGVMRDIGMPIGLTIAGPAYSDTHLLRWAAALERLHPGRTRPPRTP